VQWALGNNMLFCSSAAPTAAAFAIEARPPTGVTNSGSDKATAQGNIRLQVVGKDQG